MADFSITITNSLAFVGMAPPTLWNNFTWGEDPWGEGTDPVTKAVDKPLNESISLSDALTKGAAKALSESISPLFEMSSETKAQGIWDLLFEGSVEDAENRASTSWTEDDGQSASWSEESDPSTDWTEL